jgi:hypothetical protein
MMATPWPLPRLFIRHRARRGYQTRGIAATDHANETV